MFKKRKQQASEMDEDAITEDLLNAIPDLDALDDEPLTLDTDLTDAQPEWNAPSADAATPAPAPAPAAMAAQPATSAPQAAAPPRAQSAIKKAKASRDDAAAWQAQASSIPVHVAPPEREVTQILADVRRQMEAVFVKELDRVESSFASIVSEMEGRLTSAHDQLAQLERQRQELEQAKAGYEQRFAKLKALTQDDP